MNEHNQRSQRVDDSVIPLNEIQVRDGPLIFDIEQNPIAVEHVAKRVELGELIPVCFGEVYALICDARSPDTIAETYKLKGRPKDMKFAVLLPPEAMREVVDLDRISPNFRDLFRKPGLIESNFGSKGFLRFPVQDWYDLGPHITGADGIIQAFTFEGDPVAYPMEKAVRDTLQNKHGGEAYGEILITSFNKSGEGSITNPEKALKLSKSINKEFKKANKHSGNVDLLFLQVDRRTSHGHGSYSIYEFDLNGVHKVRGGTGQEYLDKKLGITS